MTLTFLALIFAGITLVVVLMGIAWMRRLRARVTTATGKSRVPDSQDGAVKGEVLFKSMFPDLQPYFHPARLVEWLTGYHERAVASGGVLAEIARPVPGFPQAQGCELFPDEMGRYVRVIDAEGLSCCEFHLKDDWPTAIISMTVGRFFLNLAKRFDPAVTFRCADRELDWSSMGGWRFRTPISQDEIDVDDDSGGVSISWSGWPDSSPATESSVSTAGSPLDTPSITPGDEPRSQSPGAATDDNATISAEPISY